MYEPPKFEAGDKVRTTTKGTKGVVIKHYGQDLWTVSFYRGDLIVLVAEQDLEKEE
ncbi:MAG: hypothetical protein WC623_24690 [Pedobacter sp.]|uniref:hypothetical protein n=1 Tax=Pedobacter sp. TaxID=1411316 RepID=UPI003561B731